MSQYGDQQKAKIKTALEVMPSGPEHDLLKKISDMGSDQISCLEYLCEHGSWPGGWVFSTPSKTLSLVKALVARGFATNDRSVYRPTMDCARLHRYLADARRAKREADRIAKLEAETYTAQSAGVPFERASKIAEEALHGTSESLMADTRDAVRSHAAVAIYGLRLAIENLKKAVEAAKAEPFPARE